MKSLVIYAHPNPKSFNAAIRDRAVAELKSQGHEVEVVDLYNNRFDPVLSGDDLGRIFGGKELAADVAAEQEAIRKADLLVFVAPVWWTGLPAVLKGYIDRVFTHGFAFKIGAQGVEPLLKGKKAVVLRTTGQPAEAYGRTGMYTSLRQTFDEGVLGFCGIEVAASVFFSGVPASDGKQRESWLERVAAVLKTKAAEPVAA